MTSKRNGGKAKSGAGASTGKRKVMKKVLPLKDLDAKDGKKIRGGRPQTLVFKIGRP